MENKTEDRKLDIIQKLHLDTQKWKSSFSLMNDELVFIKQLLHSYIFEPNTPNLFERLQDYLERLKLIKSDKANVQNRMVQHENNLGGAFECSNSKCDEDIHVEHEKLKANVANCLQQFQILKSEIFNYAGGILKRRRPD
ncbi:hypothetical protein [Eudoraea sp.]|uniref:hypothetical protein n=1 Tax=Eudoraea sp. TaxID=1979955 RepID=UPI003C79292F